MNQCNNRICVGYVTGLHGLRGWVKVFSKTEPRENIVKYSPWMLQGPAGIITFPVSGYLRSSGVLAKVVGIENRTQATNLIGHKIYIWPEQLPVLEAGEYYWSDLIGMEVKSVQGDWYGRVDHMMETGTSDVMVIKGDQERLIPFVFDNFVRKVDLINRRILVDWPADY